MEKERKKMLLTLLIIAILSVVSGQHAGNADTPEDVTGMPAVKTSENLSCADPYISSSDRETETEKPVINVMEKISEETGHRVNLGSAEDPYKPVAQSMAFIDGKFAVAFTDGPETKEEGVLKLFDAKGRALDIQKTLSLYHANGMCHTKEDRLLVTRRGPGTDLEIDIADGINESGERYLPYIADAVAYDSDTDKYILRTGPNLVVFSGKITENAKIFSYKPRYHGSYYQDMCAAGGYFLSCHSIDKKGENYIDIYSEATGDYFGSYYVDYGELESADIVNGELVILVHIAGETSNFLQFTGIRTPTYN